MKYIEDLIHYIDDNIEDIELPDHNLHLYCRVSTSRLEKDFENYMGFTLNSYLEQRKKEQQKEQVEETDTSLHKQKPAKTININIPEEIREQFIETIPFILNLPNRSRFAEVFIRLILLLKEAKPEFKDTYCTITHEVRNKLFQFDGDSPHDELHQYQINFHLSDQTIEFHHVGIQRFGDEENYYIPETMEPYFHMLFTLHDNLEELLGFSIKDAVKNWHTYYTYTDTDPFKVNDIIINQKSELILQTNDMIENIRETLFENCKKKVLKMYGLSFEIIQDYNESVEKNDSRKMREILSKIKNLKRKETLGLLIELTKLPEIYSTYLTSPDEVSMRGINALRENFSKEEIIDLICEYKKTVDPIEGDDKFDFDFGKWLKGKL